MFDDDLRWTLLLAELLLQALLLEELLRAELLRAELRLAELLLLLVLLLLHLLRLLLLLRELGPLLEKRPEPARARSMAARAGTRTRLRCYWPSARRAR